MTSYKNTVSVQHMASDQNTMSVHHIALFKISRLFNTWRPVKNSVGINAASVQQMASVKTVASAQNTASIQHIASYQNTASLQHIAYGQTRRLFNTWRSIKIGVYLTHGILSKHGAYFIHGILSKYGVP